MSTFKIKRYSIINNPSASQENTTKKGFFGKPLFFRMQQNTNNPSASQENTTKKGFFGKPLAFRMQDTNASMKYKLTGQQ